jgi:hypothetical protein
MEALGQHCLPFAGDPPAGKYDACQWMDLRNLGRHEGQQWYAAQYCLPQPLFPDACCTTRKALTDSMDGAILILALAQPEGLACGFASCSGSVHADLGLENRRLFIRDLSVRREAP